MPDFEWSPEAIEAASNALAFRYGNRERWAQVVLDAAVKAQPVVALPPCPTCRGKKWVERDDGHGRWESISEAPCHVCKGSGVERMVPVSVFVGLLGRSR